MSGDIAESIAIILKSKIRDIEIYGSDIQPLRINSNLCTKSFQSPKANDQMFFPWLNDIIIENEIKFYIPCSEDELLALANFSESQIESINNLAKIVWVGKLVIKKLESKRKTNNFLNSINLNPPKIFTKDEILIDFPVIVKPDIGRGSKNVFICQSEAQVKAALLLVENPIIQEFIPSAETEYTCVVYRSFNHGATCIIFRRYLSGGVTNWAEIVCDPAIKDVCLKIANKLVLNGSINIQLRKSQDRVAIFEINPRFSSTVFMRSLAGFNDLLWSLDIGNPLEEYLEENCFGARFKSVKSAERIK
jgi:carbamoyl-phosphate synthase large subunit